MVRVSDVPAGGPHLANPQQNGRNLRVLASTGKLRNEIKKKSKKVKCKKTRISQSGIELIRLKQLRRKVGLIYGHVSETITIKS